MIVVSPGLVTFANDTEPSDNGTETFSPASVFGFGVFVGSGGKGGKSAGFGGPE